MNRWIESLALFCAFGVTVAILSYVVLFLPLD
jgi:hypothetical protein